MGFENLNSNSIINHEMNCWRMDMVEHYYNHDDVQFIRTIPLMNTQANDTFIWKHSDSILCQICLPPSHGDNDLQ